MGMEGRGGAGSPPSTRFPASTGDRKQRDISKGKQDGRGVEIQRLIGRLAPLGLTSKRWGTQRLCRLRCARGRWRHPLRLDHGAGSPCVWRSAACLSGVKSSGFH